MKTKHKLIIVEESEVQDLDNFICPICQEDLVNKSYKINQIISRCLLACAISLGTGYFLRSYFG